MKLLNQSYKILRPRKLDETTAKRILKDIELAGRTCYKSEDKITGTSASDFVKMLIKRGHESVLEHQTISVRFVVDRGVSHEIVRHRLASFSQESTRYCNYSSKKHGDGINVIDISKHLKNKESYMYWKMAMEYAEMAYRSMIATGESPQIARSVLPNSLKTEIVVTANLREWREIFRQRTSAAAHPQMREVMIPLFEELWHFLPEVFGDLKEQPAKAPEKKFIPIVIAESKKTLKTRLSDLKIGETFQFKSAFDQFTFNYEIGRPVLQKTYPDDVQNHVFKIIRINKKSVTVQQVGGVYELNNTMISEYALGYSIRVLTTTDSKMHPDPMVKRIKLL